MTAVSTEPCSECHERPRYHRQNVCQRCYNRRYQRKHLARRRVQKREWMQRVRSASNHRGLDEPVPGTTLHPHAERWTRDPLVEHLKAHHGRIIPTRLATTLEVFHIHSVLHDDRAVAA